MRNKAFDDEYYKDLIVNFLSQYETATRPEIDKLLLDKLSDVLTGTQKKRKIAYVLTLLSTGEDKKIENVRNGNESYWKLINEPSNKK